MLLFHLIEEIAEYALNYCGSVCSMNISWMILSA